MTTYPKFKEQDKTFKGDVKYLQEKHFNEDTINFIKWLTELNEKQIAEAYKNWKNDTK